MGCLIGLHRCLDSIRGPRVVTWYAQKSRGLPGGAVQVSRVYTGPQDSEIATHMKMCNAKGPTVIHVAKLFPKPDCSAFDAFGRVMSGYVRPGQRVKVLGEGYTPEDEEDSASATVTNVWIYQARYRIPISRGVAGRVPDSCFFPGRVPDSCFFPGRVPGLRLPLRCFSCW